ncbi:MAG TPA: ABC transporter ATP-binding protein [Paracoccaceae bacterium]|nr:ABC transporter ATP-binding protein [Paracoccaceae bacterium]
MSAILSIKDLVKTYDGGFQALKGVSLDIEEGEIIALLGPNGAGKTTLISCVCALITPTSGSITVGGFDAQTEFRAARNLIGLVPQEVSVEPFETVWNTVRFSRGLFGKPRNDAHLESVLRSLSLWDKKDTRIMALSGGMKRRVLIAKALSHEPKVLFLDEPSAGVDVELRKDMWNVVRELRASGVTIILTTHYIEEAEEMADRIGVIAKGEILLVEEKAALMQKLGKKELEIELHTPIAALPEGLTNHQIALSEDGLRITYTYDTQAERTGISHLLATLANDGIILKDLQTRQNSLEEIFVELVREQS